MKCAQVQHKTKHTGVLEGAACQPSGSLLARLPQAGEVG